MLSILSIIFVFSVLVIVHELGHFLAAKWMGVRVDKFSIGFPPKLFSKKIGETEFVFSAIPLGGYVKMAGFIDESMDTEITGAPDEFSSKPVWRRIVIITAGVIMNLILAVAVLSILNYSQGKKILPYTTIGYVDEQGIAGRMGFEKGDRIISINGVSVRNWNDYEDLVLENLAQDIDFVAERDGNKITLTYRSEWFKAGQGFLHLEPLIPARVGEVSSGTPADNLGLQFGDEIVALDTIQISSWNQMTQVIRSHPDKPLGIKWKHQGKLLEDTIIPKAVEQKDSSGQMASIGLIGISYYYEYEPVGLVQAFTGGVMGTYNLIIFNMKGIWWVITGKVAAKDALGGPITIARMVSDAAEFGWARLWNMIAALSAILAFFNILPIPALDGGHLMVLLIEGVMRKPLSNNVRIKIQQIGLAVLLTLIVLVLYIDISRL